jgi:hypothetical protein
MRSGRTLTQLQCNCYTTLTAHLAFWFMIENTLTAQVSRLGAPGVMVRITPTRDEKRCVHARNPV